MRELKEGTLKKILDIVIPCQYCGRGVKVPWDFIGDAFCDECLKNITITDLDVEVSNNGKNRTTRL